ncbi:MAG: hypothetical protein JWN04_6493 [Myxococcaceae bacterium]|nr:hypothetical protein [Myxococcaceae bacterium]
MSRELFGAMGGLLDELELARALAIVGADLLRVPSATSQDELLARAPALERVPGPGGLTLLQLKVRVDRLERFVRHLSRTSFIGPSTTALHACWQRVFPPPSPALSFVVERAHAWPRHAPPSIDLGWLAGLFGNPELGARGVYLAERLEPLELRWDWPLRIAVAPGPGSSELLAQIARCHQSTLFHVVDLSLPGASCDLLLCSTGLRGALRAALDLPASRASAVIVLDGLEADWQLAEPWLTSLRRQLGAGAIAVCAVPSRERALWFQTLIVELSHSEPLDRALHAATVGGARESQAGYFPELHGQRAALAPPVVLTSSEFLRKTTLAHTTRRIGEASASLSNVQRPVPFDLGAFSQPQLALSRAQRASEVGRALIQAAASLDFGSESGDAGALASFKAQLLSLTGEPLALRPLWLGRAGVQPAWPQPTDRSDRPPDDQPPPPPDDDSGSPFGTETFESMDAGRAARWVQADLFAPTDAGQWLRSPRLAPEQSYTLQVFIGPARNGMAVAAQPLDESKLAPLGYPHHLRVAFTPLWRDARGALPPSQVQGLELHHVGESSRAAFYFRAPAQLSTLRGRLIVLHENRVLQTLLLQYTDVEGLPTLDLVAENRYASDFGELTRAPSFDAALVVNDSPAGVTGITAIASQGAEFFEPDGIKTIIADMRADLSCLNTPEDGSRDGMVIGLDDERIRTLLYGLAIRGVVLAETLRNVRQLQPFMASGGKIQVVDAVQGAYFPLEFVYEGKPPKSQAPRCPHSDQALLEMNLALHQQCPHRQSEDFLCPLSFWGLSRCIERQPSTGGERAHVFREPTVDTTVLRPLRHALLGASKRVRVEDLDRPAGVEAALAETVGSVARATSWTEWKSQVASEQPSLIVLLPHSMASPEVAHLPALEIGGIPLEWVRLDPDYVCPDPQLPPVVLLLGCSTSLPDIPFLSFVGRFRAKGAAVILGTLATIRGRQTVEFVRALMQEMKSASEKSGTFDEVFLRVKMRMLGNGDPFVLSLMAYGDTGWKIDC